MLEYAYVCMSVYLFVYVCKSFAEVLWAYILFSAKSTELLDCRLVKHWLKLPHSGGSGDGGE